MILLLPPSETKKSGGIEASSNWLETLSFSSELFSARTRAVQALAKLSDSADAARLLKLPSRNLVDLGDNQQLGTVPLLLPALDRYDGVLFDALHERGLKGSGTEFNRLDLASLGPNDAFVQSALFGLVDILDEIPKYRLTGGINLPGFKSAEWGPAHDLIWNRVAAETEGLIVDARSTSYVKLAPIPPNIESITVEVIAEDESGARRALNHFNKKAKGQFARAWLQFQAPINERAQLLEVASLAGLRAELNPATLTLIAS